MDFLKALTHPDEVYALIRFKFGGCEAVMPKNDQVSQVGILAISNNGRVKGTKARQKVRPVVMKNIKMLKMLSYNIYTHAL